jgi:hypothetical protein
MTTCESPPGYAITSGAEYTSDIIRLGVAEAASYAWCHYNLANVGYTPSNDRYTNIGYHLRCVIDARISTLPLQINSVWRVGDRSVHVLFDGG